MFFIVVPVIIIIIVTDSLTHSLPHSLPMVHGKLADLQTVLGYDPTDSMSTVPWPVEGLGVSASREFSGVRLFRHVSSLLHFT